MSGRIIIGAVAIAVIAALVVSAIVLGDKRHHGRRDPFVHALPTPEARAVRDAFFAAGGGPAFTCITYDAAVGDEVSDAQARRLCIDGRPRLDGEISECFCGAAAPETDDPEDPLLLLALEDLGYDVRIEEVEDVGNVTVRDGAFNVTQCHLAICDGPPPCPVLDELQARVCDKDGEPRFDSDAAACVCLNDPMPAPVPCVPDEDIPIEVNSTVVGTLELDQDDETLTLGTVLPGRCVRELEVYIGATTSAGDAQAFPALPGPFPTDDWELEIAVEADGEGPARFRITETGEYPPEWNHPGAPTFECGHVLYLEWRALVAPKRIDGTCPDAGAAAWREASSVPAEFEYRFCCAT